MTEQETIKNVLSGKTEEFEKLVKKYTSYLRKVGHYYLFEGGEVEDMIQTTFLKAFENLHKFRGDSSFKSWLIRIMINECKQSNRRKGLFRKYQNNFNKADFPLAPTTEHQVINTEIRNQLDRAISRLAPQYKSVVVQRLVMGASTSETANDLGISEEAVKIRLFRAKKKLRVDLLKESDMDQLYTGSQKYQMAYAG